MPKNKKQANDEFKMIQKKKSSPFFDKLRNTIFSSHFAIERFGIMLGTLLLFLSGALILSAKYDHDYQTQKMDSQALYTKDFETSKSQVAANVKGVFANKQRTRSFLLFKVQDTDSLPMDAKKYQFFMCGENNHGEFAQVQGQPAGIFYVFGSTGYMGLYLVNTQGFKPQILNVVGRVNSQIVDNPSSDDVDEGTFSKYDEFNIRFNPGAKKVKTISSLDDHAEPSVSELYSEMVLNKEEKSTKKDLGDELDKLQIDLNKIQDYTHRLEIYDHVRVPKAPKFIRGDKIVTKNHQKYLITKHVAKGGYNFNWQDWTIEEGFIPGIIKQNKMDPSLSDTDFLTAMQKKRKNSANSSDPTMDAIVPDSAWRYTDGKKISSDVINGSDDSDDSTSDGDSGNVSRNAQMNNDIQSLEQAWSNYISDKIEYQTDDLEQLLQLEATYHEINRFSAVNDSKSVLKLWQP